MHFEHMEEKSQAYSIDYEAIPTTVYKAERWLLNEQFAKMHNAFEKMIFSAVIRITVKMWFCFDLYMI